MTDDTDKAIVNDLVRHAMKRVHSAIADATTLVNGPAEVEIPSRVMMETFRIACVFCITSLSSDQWDDDAIEMIGRELLHALRASFEDRNKNGFMKTTRNDLATIKAQIIAHQYQLKAH